MFQRSWVYSSSVLHPEGDIRKTGESCLSYLTEVSEDAYRRLMPKYGDVFQQIQERLDSDLDDVVDDEERDRQEKKHYLFSLNDI